MSRSLLKSIDPNKGSAIESLVSDMDNFKRMVQSMLDRVHPFLIEHYTRTNVLEKIHKIEDQGELMQFQASVLPRESMEKLAGMIDAAYPKEPLHIKVLVYTEVMTNMTVSGSAYLKEQLRQRLQVLVTKQQQLTPKIIMP
jgi:hypothetical protein